MRARFIAIVILAGMPCACSSEHGDSRGNGPKSHIRGDGDGNSDKSGEKPGDDSEGVDGYLVGDKISALFSDAGVAMHAR